MFSSQPRQKLVDVSADSGAIGPHIGKLSFRHKIGEAALEGRPLLRSRPPFTDARTVGRPRFEQAKIGKPRNEGHHVDVGKCWSLAEEPWPTLAQRCLHVLESALVGIDRPKDKWRMNAEIIGRTKSVTAARVTDVRKPALTKLRRHILHLFAEHGRKADFGHSFE